MSFTNFDDRNFDKKFDLSFKFFQGAFIVWALIVLGFMGAAGYVIFHFISKFW